MKNLITRLEALTAPDREVDAAIFACCCDPPERLKGIEDVTMWAERTVVLWKGGTVTQGPVFKGAETYPNYTSSIDAALTLVPEGWTRAVDGTSGNIEVRLFPSAREERDLDYSSSTFGDHQLEAVATCIAALKAREAMK